MNISIKKLVGFELPTFYMQLGLKEAFSVVTPDGCKTYFSCYADAAGLVAEQLLRQPPAPVNHGFSCIHEHRCLSDQSEKNSMVSHQEPRSVWWMIHTSGMYEKNAVDKLQAEQQCSQTYRRGRCGSHLVKSPTDSDRVCSEANDNL